MLSHVQWFHWTPLILILRTHGFSAITQHSAQMLPTSQPRHGGGPNWWCFVIQSEKSVFAKGNTCKNGQQRFWFIESMIHISYTVIFWDIIYRELKAFTFMILYDTVSFCMSKYYIYMWLHHPPLRGKHCWWCSSLLRISLADFCLDLSFNWPSSKRCQVSQVL